MIIWILAILLVAAVWVGGYFVGLALWIKLLVTLLAVALVVGAFLFRRWRAKRAARALETELMKQAELHAANARPDRRAEIYELQAQFKKGLASLKASKLGVSGGGALYALPWYMIVGPPGAGKTTALRHSGLVFPFAGAGENASLKGVGGTRNCDWWFTNEAILLDTAGRFATHEEDREEWSAFLDMLRRYRTKKPVNGVLVAISVSDVVGMTEEQLETMAKTLRSRIDEVMTRLQMIVPVYVVFTKADLVAGFVEFFEDMKKSERAQIWGMTFPLESRQVEEPNKAFEREFDILVEALHGQAIRRIANARQVEKRARILQFPIEMRALRTNLSEFIGALLGKNAFQETPLFRGVYFTSGTQEGLPLDRVMAGMARAFGLRPQSVPEAGPAVDAKSYFLTELFGKVIFPDQHVAGRTLAEARRQMLARVAYAVGALALASLIVIPAGFSYANNRELVSSSAQIAEVANKFDGPEGSPEARLERLEPLRKRIQKLEGWHDDRPPLGHRWGLYTGEALRIPLENEYSAIVGRSLTRTVKAALEERLRSIDASSNRSSEEFNRHYDNLKKYLMLTVGPEKLPPDWSEWASPRIAQMWADLLGIKSIEDRAAVLENIRQYFLIVGPHPLQRDDQLVGRARSELLRTPQMGALYETLVRDTNTEIAPIRKETIFYGSVAPFVGAKRGLKVDGAYTKLGWAKIRRLLDVERSKLTSEGWVLGTATTLSDEDIAKQVQVLRQIYFERFREAWRDFIADLEVAQPKNAEGSLDELLALSEPEWPYLRLLRILDENVTLDFSDAEAGRPNSLVQIATDVAKTKLLGGQVDAGGALLDRERLQSPVELAFKPMTVFGVGPKGKTDGAPQPTGLGQYQAVLRKLIGVLTDLKDGKAAPDPKAITGEFETAFRATTALLADQDGFTRPLLTPLLLNPITLAWSSVLRDAGGAAGGLWEVSVWKAWSAKLEGNYPFQETAPTDTKLEDFTEFFRPQTGQLWGFYEQHLKGSLDHQGAEFIPTRRFKAAINYSPTFLSCLKRGAKITESTFAADGKTPAVAFEINLHSVSPDVAEVAIDIDGVSHTYTNTPEQWVTMQWPAKEAKVRGARVRVRGFSGLNEEIVRMGDFGFFHILDAAEVRPGMAASAKATDAPVLIATWKLRSQAGSLVKIDIRPTRADAPFSRGFFSTLRCPRVVTSGER